MGRIKEILIERRYRSGTTDELLINRLALVGTDEEKLNGETVFRIYHYISLPMDLSDVEFRQAVEDIKNWTSEDRKIYEKLKSLAEAYKIPIRLELLGDC
jgi:hypothetical protein